MGSLARFIALPPAERRRIVAAAGLLAATRVGLWMLPFRWVHRASGGSRASPGPRGGGDRTARHVHGALPHDPALRRGRLRRGGRGGRRAPAAASRRGRARPSRRSRERGPPARGGAPGRRLLHALGALSRRRGRWDARVPRGHWGRHRRLPRHRLPRRPRPPGTLARARPGGPPAVASLRATDLAGAADGRGLGGVSVSPSRLATRAPRRLPRAAADPGGVRAADPPRRAPSRRGAGAPALRCRGSARRALAPAHLTPAGGDPGDARRRGPRDGHRPARPLPRPAADRVLPGAPGLPEDPAGAHARRGPPRPRRAPPGRDPGPPRESADRPDAGVGARSLRARAAGSPHDRGRDSLDPYVGAAVVRQAHRAYRARQAMPEVRQVWRLALLALRLRRAGS